MKVPMVVVGDVLGYETRAGGPTLHKISISRISQTTKNPKRHFRLTFHAKQLHEIEEFTNHSYQFVPLRDRVPNHRENLVKQLGMVRRKLIRGNVVTLGNPHNICFSEKASKD